MKFTTHNDCGSIVEVTAVDMDDQDNTLYVYCPTCNIILVDGELSDEGEIYCLVSVPVKGE